MSLKSHTFTLHELIEFKTIKKGVNSVTQILIQLYITGL